MDLPKVNHTAPTWLLSVKKKTRLVDKRRLVNAFCLDFSKVQVRWSGSEGISLWAILYLEICNSWSTAGFYTSTALFNIFKEWPGGADRMLAHQVCRWHQTGERSVNMLKYMAAFQWPRQAGGTGVYELHEIQGGQMQRLAFEMENSLQHVVV